MTYVLAALGSLVLILAAGFALAAIAPPPPPPPNRLVGRLWQARSIWRETKGPRGPF